MSLCPFAAIRLLPESGTQPTIAPRIAILHSAAGRGSLYKFFRDASNLESHFWVSESGLIEQYMDTNRRADANRNANGYAVSIETESSPSATERWAPAQAAAIVKLLDWICTEHPNVKRRQCDSPTGSGIGWHIMFGTPGPWTPVAKSCPGPARIAQARDEIIPAVAAVQTPAPIPEDDMPYTEAQLAAIVGKAVANELTKVKADLAEVKRQVAKSEDAKAPNGRTLRHIVATDLNNGG